MIPYAIRKRINFRVSKFGLKLSSLDKYYGCLWLTFTAKLEGEAYIRR